MEAENAEAAGNPRLAEDQKATAEAAVRAATAEAVLPQVHWDAQSCQIGEAGEWEG